MPPHDPTPPPPDPPPGASWLDPTAWQELLFEPLRAFIASVLGNPSTRPPRASARRATAPSGRPRAGARITRLAEVRERLRQAEEEAIEGALPLGDGPHLPCDLYLTLGTQSIRIFPAGPIDDLAFFQRRGVAEHHELEYVTRLEPDAEHREAFRPYGLFRLHEAHAQPVPTVEATERFRTALYRELGLVKLPRAKQLVGRPFVALDLRRGHEDGLDRILPAKPTRAVKKLAGRVVTQADVVAFVRRELDPLQKLAWIEESCGKRPPTGEIVHRYYLDGRRRAWLVRHHWAEGKTLYRVQTSADAFKIIEESGLFPRPQARAG